MSYVKDPFQHDIFVSYSHGDVDGTGGSPLKAWSQGFVKVLEEELKTAGSAAFTHELARSVSIYLDQDHRPSHGVDPMEPLGEQLKSEVGRSAVLLILACRQYQESAWCTKEREWWLEQQNALGLPFLDRIAAALVFPTDLPWPAPIGDGAGKLLFTGFPFIDPQQPRPHEWPVPQSTSRGPFRTELVKMVGVIGEKLFQLRKHLEERQTAAADAAKLQGDEKQVIYLHGRAAHEGAWGQAFESLTGSGYPVFPAEPEKIPQDAEGLEKIRQERVDTMSRCDALLLVATADGAAADQDLVAIGRQDRNSARARSQRLIPCALLDTAGLAVTTPRRQMSAKSLSVQWIDARNTPWTPEIKQWLAGAGGGGR